VPGERRPGAMQASAHHPFLLFRLRPVALKLVGLKLIVLRGVRPSLR
jgi:hypothetical protein